MTGTAPGVGTITPISPSGGFAASYTVNVSTTGAAGANNGTVRLDLTSLGTIQDQATNALAATHIGDQTYNFDTTRPTATTINRQAGAPNPTNATTLPFTVTFSEPVDTSTVVAARFTVTTSGVTGTAPTRRDDHADQPLRRLRHQLHRQRQHHRRHRHQRRDHPARPDSGGTIADQAGNVLTVAHNGDQIVQLRHDRPTVSTINIAGASTDQRDDAAVHGHLQRTGQHRRRRRRPVRDDHERRHRHAPTVGTITPISPSGGFATSYTVNVNTTGAIGANNGTVRLDQTSSGTIADQAGNGPDRHPQRRPDLHLRHNRAERHHTAVLRHEQQRQDRSDRRDVQRDARGVHRRNGPMDTHRRARRYLDRFCFRRNKPGNSYPQRERGLRYSCIRHATRTRRKRQGNP